MEEDTEYLKLPLEDRCIHKVWRARVHGYEECIKLFPQITDEKSPEFTKFAPLMKKFVTDSNAVAQEKALEAVLAFATNAHIAQRVAVDVASGVVAKALGGPRRGTLDKAEAVLLMYCEIEKYAVVQEELIKGFAAKNPKVVVACVKILTTALREFGHKVISPKPLVKQFSRLMEDRDKNVREEGKKLLVEMHRWIGDALKPQLTGLKPLQVQELEAEFEKAGGGRTVQTRFLRSQQELKERIEAAGDDDEEADEDDETDAPAVDAYDLMDPVDILEKLPKDFYEKAEAKKWQDRKEAMEALLPLTTHQKLEAGDYHELMKILKKIIAKDSNVMIVALAGQCMAGIARGLKKKFAVFAVVCIETVLDKFKEKKTMVLNALREAADAIFHTTNLESLQESISSRLTNKNPNVKAETAAYLSRCLRHCTPAVVNKKLVKTLATDLLKTLNESDPTVRDNTAEALGTLMRVVGEKVILPFLGDLDATKMAKIKEACEKVEMKVKVPTTKAKPKPVAPADTAVVRPASAAVTKAAGKPVGAVGTKRVKSANPPPHAKKSVGGGGGGGPSECDETELGAEEVAELAEAVLGEEVMTGLTDANWKERLAALETINTIVSGLDNSAPCQAIVRTIAQKPGLKDSNFQVLKLKLTALQTLAENTNFTRVSCEVCISELVEKLGDVKNGVAAAATLTAMAEAASLEWLGPEVASRAFQQKNPKVQEAAFKWLAQAVTDFGFILQPKNVINDIKKGLSHTSPAVRNAAVALCGTIHLHMGPALRSFLEDEKPALLQLIDAEIEKNNDRSAPAPVRRRRVLGGGGSGGGEDDVDLNSEDVANSNVASSQQTQDLIPRTNVSDQITDQLISELGDKNWKVRAEALGKVASILHTAKFITGDVGELCPALTARLTDINKNISLEALKVVGQLAEAAGQHVARHTRTVVPGIMAALGDSKPNIRAAALSVLDTWTTQAGGVKEVMDGDVCVDALKSGSALLKAALIPWMAAQLKDAPVKSLSKDELAGCVPHLLAGVEDRNADVRRAAADAILPFMLHLGYEGVAKHLAGVKPASKKNLQQILDKARQSLPARPVAPPTRQLGAGGKAPPAGRGTQRPQTGSAGGGPYTSAKRNTRAVTAPAASSRTKPAEEVDNSTLLPVNNCKQQRHTDEQKLRALRWDFIAPRQEFITQLRDQMTTAGLNTTLVTNMFHKDFNFHKKSLDALHGDLQESLDGCISNLDLILRWVTLRFFDTNPSVIIRAMDYLQAMFTRLAEDGYHLMDYEAYAFLPFLIQKFGDPKDPIRGPARSIMRTICNIYPASKVSPYVLEGIKTKNARQRAVCLEALGSLVESAGVSVCQPSPAVALKEVAKQISDKDKTVRNAALNTLLQVYFRDGDKLFKYIGQLSSKDMGFLEERIRQAGKNRAPVIRKPDVAVTSAGEGSTGVQVSRVGVRGGNRVIPSTASEFNPTLRGVGGGGGGGGSGGEPDVNSLLQRYRQRAAGNSNNSNNTQNTSNKFHLDYSVVERLLEDDDDQPIPVEVESIPDLSSLLNFHAVCPKTSSRLARPGFSIHARVGNANLDAEDAAQAINLVISQVSSSSSSVVVRALCQVNEVVCSTEEQRWRQLLPHVDQLLVMATVQYRLVLNTKLPAVEHGDLDIAEDTTKIYRALTNCLMMLFNQPVLAAAASRDVLADVWHVLLSTLIDARLTTLQDGPQVIRSFNVLVVRMAEKADFTSVFSASLKLLHDCVGAGGGGSGGKFGELVLKCNWKIIQMLSKRAKDLQLFVILKDVHHFLTSYPMNTWADRSDVPLRTIKTIIFTLCKYYGYSVLPHLDKIPGAQGSELQKYITKTLKKVSIEDGTGTTITSSATNRGVIDTSTDNQNHLQQQQLLLLQQQQQLGLTAMASGGGALIGSKSPKRLSKAANNSLSEIFRKIGSKENTKEGLVELYEFQLLHPEADIGPFLSKSSQFFQNYIERGLKKVKMEREMKMNSLATHLNSETNSNSGPLSSIQVTTDTTNSTSAAGFNMNELVDQFKTIASQAGFDNTYIDSAVKDICSAKKGEEVKDYNKILKSVTEFVQENKKE